MIDASTLLTYGLIVLGFVFIPGPATLLTMARASSSGPWVGISTGAGIAMGDIIHTLLAIVGISAIVATSALAFTVVKYAGAAYLIYLGVRALFGRAAIDPARGALMITPGRAFGQAVLAEVLNPKTALFFLAFLPQFVNPGAGLVVAQLLVLGLVFVVLGFFSTVVFALCAAGLGRLLRTHPAVVRWQTRAVGTVFCGLGVRLALQER